MVQRSGNSVKERWCALQDVVKESDVKVVGYKGKRNARKPWVTTEMINKMDESRKWKNVNVEEGKKRYKQLNNELRKETEKRGKWAIRYSVC